MEYRKPEVVAAVDATLAIEGMKPDLVADNTIPRLRPSQAGAYLSDE